MRNGTQDLHSQIEEFPIYSALMKDQVTLGDYAQALEALSGFYANMELQLIFGLLHHFPKYNYVSRLNLLNHDLLALGIAKDIKPIQNIANLPNKAGILGLLYVVEGSTLGGQIITRHLKERLGSQISDALRFYTLDGKMQADHWAKVKQLFRENLKESDEIVQSVIAARQAFNNLLR